MRLVGRTPSDCWSAAELSAAREALRNDAACRRAIALPLELDRIVVLAEHPVGYCSVTFADQGPGIPAEIREKIFAPFFTTKARGTGLGLPTAKRLVEAQRGSISIECPPTGGTTVTVQLPTS